jgi:hypothetical protein
MLNDDTVEVFRNRKTGAYRVQPYARTRLSSQPFGPQTIVAAAEAEKHLLQAVLENLDKNSLQRYDEAEIPHSSEQEFRRSLREDQLMYVRRSAGKYHLIPFRRMGNSWGSIEELEVWLSEDEFLKRGCDLIQRSFAEMP